MADRYCRNCGHQLGETDRYCPSCGSPVHEVAHVPTPEADVPVPPPPEQYAGGGTPPQEPGTDAPAQGGARKLVLLGCGTLVVVVLLGGLVSALAGGGGGGGGESNKPKPTAPVEPELAVSAPAESMTVTGNSFEVKGKVTPPDAEVTVNGTRITTESGGSFTNVVNLAPGENEIEIIASNSGEMVEYSRVVTRKLTAEEIAAKKEAEQQATQEAETPQQPREPAQQQQQQQPAQQQEEQQASVPSFGDGVYRVGADIQPGTYRTRQGSPNCYWERVRDFTGNFNSILANGNTDAPAVVTIRATDVGFSSQGCGTWTKDLSAITESRTSFGEGAYIVGTDMDPGTYRNSGGNNCYWERVRNFTGGFNSIVANGNTNTPTIVTIKPTDAGFQSLDCGTWTKLE